MTSKNKKSPPSPTSKMPKKLKTLEAKKPAEPTNRPQGLTVVGIGASAGGLSALNSFFDALSPDTGMAFVVVMHLHPTYESHLAELLQQHTQMPIRQVTRKIKVEAGAYTHQDVWTNVQLVEPQTGWSVFWFILRNNFLILGLIALGNLFVRFGSLTPGLLILAIQLVTIGWTSGTNSFMEPFPSLAAVNTAFVQIGLWEITAYISIRAITLNKSLFVADTFPAKKWAKVTPLREVAFTRTEISASFVSLLALLTAAYTEAFLALPISG